MEGIKVEPQIIESETNVGLSGAGENIAKMDQIIFVLLMVYAGVICFPVAYGNAVMDLVLVFAGIRLWGQRSDIMIEPGLVKAYLLLFLAVAVSAVTAQNSHYAYFYVWHYFYYTLPLFLGLWFVRGQLQSARIVKMISLSLFTVSLLLIIQSLQGIGRPPMLFGQFVHIFGQNSQFVPLLMTLVIYDKTYSFPIRLLFALAATLAGIVLIFFAYRGALLAIFFALAVLAVLSVRHRPKLVAVLVGVFLIWAVVTVVIVKILPYEHIVNLITRDSASVSTRLFLWDAASRMIIDYPMLGVGLRNFSEQFGAHYVLPYFPEKTAEHAHNTLLNVFAEMGLVGVSAYLYMMFYIARHYWHRLRTRGMSDVWALAALIATCGMIMEGMSDVNFLYFPAVMQTYYFLIGITWENA